MQDSPNIPLHAWSDFALFTESKWGKVAGTLYDTTDQFGKEIKAVKGTKDDIIKVLPEPEQPQNNWLVKVEDQEVDPPVDDNVENIVRSITASKEQKTIPVNTKDLDLISFDEVKNKYSDGLTDAEYRIWCQYQLSRTFNKQVVQAPGNGWKPYTKPITEMQYLRYFDQGLVGYDGKDWVPAPVLFSGNVYEKEQQLISSKPAIVAKINEQRYEKQIAKMRNARPRILRLTDPSDERLLIKVQDSFWKGKTFDTTEYGEGGIKTLFSKWLFDLPKTKFKYNYGPFWIIKLGVDGGAVDSDWSPAKRAEAKRQTAAEVSRLFPEFLLDVLDAKTLNEIEIEWNAKFNNRAEIDYKKIPVGIEINRYFKAGKIDPRPALWEGVKYMSANGSMICAFDVGVGKTMMSILAMAQALYTGQCKRPLIIVPDPTYAKWISEIIGIWNEQGECEVHGVLPQYKDRILDYHNFGKKKEAYIEKHPVQDGYITIATYEIFNKVGFSEQASQELFLELYSILNAGLESRDAAKLGEKVDKLLGKVAGLMPYNFDDFGWDYIVLDEAHNCKNIFASVKGEVVGQTEAGNTKREKNQYAIQGSESARGIAMFAYSQYVMRKNGARNILLLTATPFTNSPLEIYSMISLVAYQTLKERGLSNVKDFFDKFVEQSFEATVGATGSFKINPVIRNFNNREVLQSIIFDHILHKTGEQANVKRPVKVVYPRFKDSDGLPLELDAQVDTALKPTIEQQSWLDEIANFEMGVPNKIEAYLPKELQEDRGATTLLSIHLAQACTLSPHLMSFGKKGEKEYLAGQIAFDDGKSFVESSPKLQYALESIRTIKKWHDSQGEAMSGVVVYMNRGKDYFPGIAEYFRTELGFEKKEVAVLNSDNSKRKEQVKRGFLDNEIKILFGTQSIKEGIDLQDHATTLFNLTLDWNPTDIQQLEGRIWRQGNKHSHVRIVTPLIENSVDVFMFQKLEEKTSRINNIWYRAGRSNILDVDKFDPADLKMGLISDPNQKADLDIREARSRVERDITIVKENIELFRSMASVRNKYNQAKEAFEAEFKYVPKIVPLLEQEIELEPDNTDRQKEIKSKRLAKLKSLQNGTTEKERIALAQRVSAWLNKSGNRYTARVQELRQQGMTLYAFDRVVLDWKRQYNSYQKVKKSVLDPNGLTLDSQFDDVIAKYEGDLVKFTEKLEQIQSDEYKAQIIEQFKEDREKAQKFSKDVQGRVQEFTKHNYLLSCLTEYHDCSVDEGGIKFKAAQTVQDEIIDDAEPATDPVPIDFIKERLEGLKIAYEVSPTEQLGDRIEALELSLTLVAWPKQKKKRKPKSYSA